MSALGRKSDRYLIEIDKGGRKQRLVWNSARPLPLGFPVRWLAERSETGLRFRNLETRSLRRTYDDGVFEIQAPEGSKSVMIDRSDLRLRVSRLRSAAPAFTTAQAKDGSLVAYLCLRESIVLTARPNVDGTVRWESEAAFRVRPTADGGLQLEALAKGLEIRYRTGSGVEKSALDTGRSLEIPASRVSVVEIAQGRHSWRLGYVSAVAIDAVAKAEILDGESLWFRKQMARTSIGLALMALALALWPVGKKVETPNAELIPEQFAKIVMQPKPVRPVDAPKVAGGGGSPEAGGTAAGPREEGKAAVQATRASDTAVARAFRTKALQNSVKGLLKGGMTTFLAQGGTLLLGADDSNQVQKIFDEKGVVGALPASPDAGYAPGPSVKVSVGGGGFGGKGGSEKGIGYGTGQRAGIGGQGGAFVSLDLPGSSVEDGLSKDEVGKVIHAHLSEVRYCYESSMIRNPDIEGKLVLDFTIGAQGSVTSASVKESSLNDPRLDDCILRRLTKWSFPKPKGGASVAVSYPFIFKALQR